MHILYCLGSLQSFKTHLYFQSTFFKCADEMTVILVIRLYVQSHLIGIVVPDPEVFVKWAKERGIVGSYEELCQNPVSFTTLHNTQPHNTLKCFNFTYHHLRKICSVNSDILSFYSSSVNNKMKYPV